MERTAPFHLDISAHSAAPDLQSLLLKIVHDEALARRIAEAAKRFRRAVRKSGSGRLTGCDLTGCDNFDIGHQRHLCAQCRSLSRLDAAGSAMTEDSSSLRTRRDRWGALSFDGVGVSLDHDGGRRLSVDSARVSLDLQQMEILLQRFKNVAAQFARFQSARGSIELERLALIRSL